MTFLKRFSQFVALSFLISIAPIHQAKANVVTAEEAIQRGYDDPFEGLNRAIFEFNRGLDAVLIKPVARGYKYVVPGNIRTNLRNFVRNLASPIILINELLQGDLKGAETVIKRFVVNSTLGFAGLADPAGEHGLPAPTREDFGQTLGKWGAQPGPYLVLPLLGPSNFRDAAGTVFDTFMDPVNWWAWENDEDGVLIGRAAVATIDGRAQLLGVLDPTLDDAIDPYLTLKSIYEQRREKEIRDIVASSRKSALVASSYDAYGAYENGDH